MSTPNPVPRPPPGFELVDGSTPPPPAGFVLASPGYKPPDSRHTHAVGAYQGPIQDRQLWPAVDPASWKTAAVGGAVADTGGLLRGVAGLPQYAVEAVKEHAPLLNELAPIVQMPAAVNRASAAVEQTGKGIQQRGEAILEKMPPPKSWVDRQVRGVARSAPAYVGAAVASLITKNPDIGALVASVQQYGNAYSEVADNPNISPASKQAYAATTGFVEGIFEMGPQRALLEFGKPFVKYIGNLLAWEIPSEEFTSVLQQKAAERYKVSGPLTRDEWATLIIDTAVQTAALAGGGGAIIKAGEAAVESIDRRAQEAQQDKTWQELARQQAVDALRPENAQLVEQRPEIPAPPPGFQLADSPLPTPDLTPVPQQPVDLTPPQQTAAPEVTPDVAPQLTASGVYRDGGKWSATYETVQRTDGSFVVKRKFVDDEGERTEYLSQAGYWRRGEPALAAVRGAFAATDESPEVFQSEKEALDILRAYEDGINIPPPPPPAGFEVVEEQPPAPTRPPNVRKDFPETMYRGYGRAEKGSVYTDGPNGRVDVPIAGAGQYFALDETRAKKYGPNVESRPTSDLKNPLVIESDKQWRELTRAAGWEFPNPFGANKQTMERYADSLRKIILDRGHDSLVVDWPVDDMGDFNESNPDRTWKLLRNVFAIPQVVVYGKATRAATAKPKPKTTPPAPTAIGKRLAADKPLRDALRKLKEQTGWAQEGGKIIRQTEDTSSPDYKNVTGRTPWLPKADWWLSLAEETGDNWTAKQVDAIIDKALSGKKLTPKQTRLMDFLLKVAEGQTRGRGTLTAEEVGDVMFARSGPPTQQGADLFGNDIATQQGLSKKQQRVGRKLGEGREAPKPEQAPRGDLFREAAEKEAPQQTDIEDVAPAILEVIPGDNGTEVRIAKNIKGFAVTLRDTDSGQTVPHVRIFPTLEGARAHARKMAGSEDSAVPARTAPATSEGVQKAATTFAPGVNYQPMIYQGITPPPGGVVLDQVGVGGPPRPLSVPDKPVNRRAIMAELQRQFGMKVYQGKPFKVRGAEGFFRPRNFEVRIKKHNDLQVTAHEVWHWLDRTFPSIRKLYHQPRFSAQLKALSYNKDNLGEGFAEFGRLFMTQEPNALRLAPEFYQAFVTELKRLGIYRRTIAIQEKMHQWYLQGAEGRALSKIGEQPLPFSEWAQQQYQRVPDQFIQKSVDWLHSWKVVERVIRGDVGTAVYSPYKDAILAQGARGVVQAVFEHGTIAFDADGNIQFTGKGLRQVMQPVADVFEDAMLYFLGRRAQETRKQGRERLFTPDEIEALLDRGRKSPKYAEIKKAFEEWQAFLDRMMKFYIQTGIVSKESADLMRIVNENYVPMHRISEALDRAPGKAPAANLFKRLRGGTENVHDTWTDMLGTVGTLVTQGLRNHAKTLLYATIESSPKGQQFAVRVASEQKATRINTERILKQLEKAMTNEGRTAQDAIKQALAELEANPDIAPEILMYWSGKFRPTAPDIDMVLVGGEPRYFQVADPLLWETLQIWNNPKVAPLAMRMLAGFSGTLRRGVTSAPDFWLPNLVRDTMQAWAISDSGFKPFLDTLNGASKAIRRDEDTWLFFANGGGFSSLLHADAAAYRKRMERFYVDRHIDYRSVIDAPYKLIDFYDAVMSAGEYGTRVGEFTRAMKQGKGAREAAYLGRQISTDFGMHGSSQTVAWLRAGVAFLNARMQGGYLLERQVFEKEGRVKFNPQRATRLALRGLIGMVLPTLYLLRMNKDEEWYKSLPDWVKWTHWVMKVGDRVFLFPKPFEIGALFATIPEATMQYIADKDGEKYADAMLFVLTNMFEFSIIPTAARGPFEVAANENFAGRPITPEYLKGVSSDEQFLPWTSETAILVGRTEVAKKFGISPIKFEHLLRSYLGTMSMYMLTMSDALIDPEMTGLGEPPSRRTSDWYVLRRFVREQPYRGTAQEQQFYDLLEASRQVVRDFNKRVAELRPEDAGKGLRTAEEQRLYALNIGSDKEQSIEALASELSSIRAAMRTIRFQKNLSGDEKRDQLDVLQAQYNMLLDAATQSGLTMNDVRKQEEKTQ